MQPEVHIPPADCLANPDYPLGGGLLELVQILDRESFEARASQAELLHSSAVYLLDVMVEILFDLGSEFLPGSEAFKHVKLCLGH